MPSQFEDENFFDMQRVLSTPDKQEKHVDPASLVDKFDTIGKP